MIIEETIRIKSAGIGKTEQVAAETAIKSILAMAPRREYQETYDDLAKGIQIIVSGKIGVALACVSWRKA